MRLFGRKKEEVKKESPAVVAVATKAKTKPLSKKTNTKEKKESKKKEASSTNKIQKENETIIKNLRKNGMDVLANELSSIHIANEVIRFFADECTVINFPDDLHAKLKKVIKDSMI